MYHRQVLRIIEQDKCTSYMKQEQVAPVLYQTLEKHCRAEHPDALHETEVLYRLLNKLFVLYTEDEKLQFTTLFSRIAYVAQQANIPAEVQFFIHRFRKQAQRALRQNRPVDKQLPVLGARVVCKTIQILWQTDPPPSLLEVVARQWPHEFRPVPVAAFYTRLRAVLTGIEPELRHLLAQTPEAPGETLRVQYDIADRNENFNPSVQLMQDVFSFPLTVNLLDVEVDQEGILRPKGIVIEPDYLLDVTAVAECFKNDGTLPVMYLTRKFLPFQTSVPLLLGNIANFFLDELMHQPQQPFRQIFRKVFRLNPLAFSLIPDRDLREIMQKAQKHFVNLQRVLHVDLPEQGIQAEHCYLEPTFYSDQHGLQGRLDILSRQADKTHIIELKSGKVFRPNVYGLNVNHFTQTLLYDLMIRAAFGEKTDPQNYILYSGADDRNLRFAPVVRAQQLEALQLRNHLLALEKQLSMLGLADNEDILAQGHRLFQQLHPTENPGARGFVQRDLQHLTEVYQTMPRLVKQYVLAFCGFIAREHRLAKTGLEGIERVNGQASLWLDDFADKQQAFNLLSHLSLVDNQAGANEPLLHFIRTDDTNELANFRTGDIAVLYPMQDEEASPLSNQLFKCTIVELNAERVTVRLRSRQFNDQLFRTYELWCLEHDLLDSGFNDMYRSLFAFARQPEEKRALLLGLRPPQPPREGELLLPDELTPEQKGIFQSILRSEEYFLLWGPPGTGKTSIMLKHLVGYWYEQTDENIVILAYTNRAVDEICAAISSYSPAMRTAYLRIGSRYSTDPRYRDRLLSRQTEEVDTREGLRELIRRHRIIVGTVSSVANKSELFSLKKFDRVLIDEASQILEPMLVGLLPYFKHFTLIGDHKQLPAVVVQPPTSSQVRIEELYEIGLYNLRNSLFERLYKRCLANEWNWAYAQLSHQGRMHRDLMAFPNQFFYEGKLNVLPTTVPAHQRQIAELSVTIEEDLDGVRRQLAIRRMVFLPTPIDVDSLTRKTNLHEANLIAELIGNFRQLYEEKASIGVITPYRAQIAQIRQVLEQQGLDDQQITIDTVERYQGGARDIILISLCTNTRDQLEAMVSLSEEGIDRKLNVALTRARQHLVIVGNPELLQENELYRQLMQHCADLD